MGLDMYLWKKTSLYPFIIPDGCKVEINISGVDPTKVIEITEKAAYWRKASHIHNWFVQNACEGKDDCKEHWVSKDMMEELVEKCKIIIHGWEWEEGEEEKPYLERETCTKKTRKLAERTLPQVEGFFFGGTEVNGWYLEGCKETVAQLTPIIQLLQEIDDAMDATSLTGPTAGTPMEALKIIPFELYYQSSW